MTNYYISKIDFPALRRLIPKYVGLYPEKATIMMGVLSLMDDADQLNNGVIYLTVVGWSGICRMIVVSTFLDLIEDYGDLFVLHMLAERLGVQSFPKTTEYIRKKNFVMYNVTGNYLGV